jgi:DNA-binding transcriptional MerR regulator
MPSDDEQELVKVSVLAEMSGVPAATIKHYVREGLLPDPVRTSKNMAYYSPSLVGRIKQIKELQRTRFLPLKVIKQVLDESELEQPHETVAATIARVIEQTAPADERTRAQLLESGLIAGQLDLLRKLGLVSPVPGRAHETYAGDDLELLRVLGAARKAGITEKMLPMDILAQYASALGKLVQLELALFRDGVVPHTSAADLPTLTEAATTLSERLVMLMRRKMLVPMMRTMAEEERQKKLAEAEATARASERPPARARSSEKPPAPTAKKPSKRASNGSARAR